MRKFVIAASCLLVIAAISAWFFARPVYHRYKERRSLGLAECFMKQAEYKKAWLSVRQVLALNPTNIEGCRIAADLADLSHSPAAVGWRQKIAELSPTTDNRLMLASCALRNEVPPYPLATKTLESLARDATNQASYHVLSAERAIRLNLIAEAVQHLEAAMRLDPTNQVHALNVAVLRLQSSDPSTAAQARSRLHALSAHPEYGLIALRSLATDSFNRKDWPAAIQFSSRVLTNTNSTFADRIQHLSILQGTEIGDRSSKFGPNSQGAKLEDRSSKFGSQLPSPNFDSGPNSQLLSPNSDLRSPTSDLLSPNFHTFLATLQQTAATNVANIADLASWMNANERPAQTVTWLKALPADVRSQMPLPLLLAGAYMIQKDWTTLQTWLHDQKWDDQEFMRFAILSRALRGQGEEEVGTINWNKALRAASDRPELLAALANVAQGWGWTNQVEEALWASAKQYPAESSAFLALERHYYFRGDTRSLFRVYSAMLEQNPNDLLARNNLATVCWLLKTNLDRAHPLAHDVYEQHQTNPVIASTYAFSLHLQGKTAEGLEVLGKLSGDDLRRSGVATYYAVLLKAADQTNKAQAFRQLAERGPLLPEERTLLDSPLP
jgi:tetratricopeptide (TPR) repeat protein